MFVHILFFSPVKDRAQQYTDLQCRELHHLYEHVLGRRGQNNGNVCGGGELRKSRLFLKMAEWTKKCSDVS
jgi:hypothetical protein